MTRTRTKLAQLLSIACLLVGLGLFSQQFLGHFKTSEILDRHIQDSLVKARSSAYNERNTSKGEARSSAYNERNTSKGEARSSAYNERNTSKGEARSSAYNERNTSKGEVRSSAYNERNTSQGEDFLIPPDHVLRKMSEEKLLLLYWRYVNTLQVLCRNVMRHGVLADGGKEICIDEAYVPRKPCLVYSFGSALRFDFEDSISRAYGCEIHTFDPSIRIDDTNRERIPAHVRYHEIGLAGRNYMTRGGWSMRTLTSVIKNMGHEHRVIDILKIDAEGGEWRAFQTSSNFRPLENVKQISVELHFGLMGGALDESDAYWGGIPSIHQLQVLRTLYEKGFRIFMREHIMSYVENVDTVYGPQLCSINEISLINLKWKS